MKALVATAALLAASLSTPLLAAPTASFATGATTLTPATAFTSALTSRNVTIAPIKGTKLKFPVNGGRADLANARAEISHSGGVTLKSATVTVELSNFIIDTTSTPTLTGLVVVNGSVVGRIALFKVALPTLTLPLTAPQQKLNIPGNTLTLTAAAASALNGAFSVSAFAENAAIGPANVALTGVKMPN
jgi:hypothetical protein